MENKFHKCIVGCINIVVGELKEKSSKEKIDLVPTLCMCIKYKEIQRKSIRRYLRMLQSHNYKILTFLNICLMSSHFCFFTLELFTVDACAKFVIFFFICFFPSVLQPQTYILWSRSSVKTWMFFVPILIRLLFTAFI